MDFIVDKQTMDDLNLLGKFNPNSIYGLFSKVKTSGGQRLLEQMFTHPLTTPAAINSRSELFRFFGRKDVLFPFDAERIRQAEDYLLSFGAGSRVGSFCSVARTKVLASVFGGQEYEILHQQLVATISVLGQAKQLLARLSVTSSDPFFEKAVLLDRILNSRELAVLFRQKDSQLGLSVVANIDFLLRRKFRRQMEQVLEGIYELDVYIAVAGVARERGLSYAVALPASVNTLQAEALWHPALAGGIANPVMLGRQKNVLFLTGANMAGKSTFMKSVGTAVYLAHMGFPVAAKGMQFSVRDGLFTSINVSDNINEGYSHFYAEVLRVKEAAELISSGRNMIVIFDELFKGTNVKDAFDATLAVTNAFSRYRKCTFIISTHIIEVGEELRAFPNVQFGFMPTKMEGNIPRYTYQMQEGITSDRHGMMIVRNEGILDIIRDHSRAHSSESYT